MIDTQGMSPDTIRKIGLELLSRELGPDGMIEFLQQYSLGTGTIPKNVRSIYPARPVNRFWKRL
jgi:hypothetical protein